MDAGCPSRPNCPGPQSRPSPAPRSHRTRQDRTMNDTETVEQPEAPALDPNAGRFALFKGEDFGWVLRDNTTKPAFDYPFLTKAMAVEGMQHRLEGHSLQGSKAKLNVYGEPLEGLEVFA
ncbi:hypothetical protein SEA_CLAYDA5_52 [Microbacterium phage Clayda5]|nr:hypothetical protein SEA_CLAYDA5_52 [Microbacterium phage Clayda5]